MKSTTTIGQLMKKYGVSRVEAEGALGNLEFKIGSKNAHLFDKSKAEELVAAAAQTSTELKRIRLEKAKVELALATQKKEAFDRDMISADDALALVDSLSKAVWSAIRSSRFLSYPQELQIENTIERSVVDAMRRAGISVSQIKPRLKALEAKERQSRKEIKLGKYPDDWFETVRPENTNRIYSQELQRYYTKREIIAKFGRGVKISPIDEVLDEAAEMEE